MKQKGGSQMSEENITYTQEQVDKMVQSERDKIRTDYTKQIKELQGKLPEEKDEKEVNLEKRLKTLEQKEKMMELKEKLQGKGFDQSLSEFINPNSDIEKLAEILKVQQNQNYVPGNHKSTESSLTKEQFQNMGYTERAKIYNDSPELYKKLSS
jgi:pyridoxine 5'-phosphate synthase PdxJ